MPIRMSRIGLTTAGAALAALLLAGCPTNDVDGSDLADALEEAGATQDQADCAADRFDDELDQDERNDVAEASSDEEIEDLPESVRTTYEAIMAECIAGEAPAEETSSTTAAGEGGEGTEESTTTTAAE
jgi:hypothetical protein